VFLFIFQGAILPIATALFCPLEKRGLSVRLMLLHCSEMEICGYNMSHVDLKESMNPLATSPVGFVQVQESRIHRRLSRDGFALVVFVFL
jgi:hypothetical protein